MHTIEDGRRFGIFSDLCIHHNSDWSGDVRIEWRESGVERGLFVSGKSLLIGVTAPASHRSKPYPGDVDINELPADVTGRAVALAVRKHARSMVEHLLDEMDI